MKKGHKLLDIFRNVIFLFGIWAIVILLSSTGHADLSFDDFHLKHSAIILVIEPETGRIVDANDAASQFYGYKHSELLTMGIQDVNVLSKEEVAKERILAKEENRNFFIFRHKLKSGEVKTVEVYSNPYDYKGRTVLISIIHDISIQREIQNDLWHYQSSLESMVDLQTNELKKTYAQTTIFLSIGILVLIILVIALVILIRKHKEAKKIVENERQQLNEII